MKIIIMLSFIFSNISYASEYLCSRGKDDPEIILKIEHQNLKFQLIEKGQFLLNISIPETALNTYHENKSIGPVLSFVPGWGESDGSIYGRFSEEGAVFDIYVSGMIGHVATTVTNYSCRFQE